MICVLIFFVGVNRDTTAQELIENLHAKMRARVPEEQMARMWFISNFWRKIQLLYIPISVFEWNQDISNGGDRKASSLSCCWKSWGFESFY
jgi:hypothetical protein